MKIPSAGRRTIVCASCFAFGAVSALLLERHLSQAELQRWSEIMFAAAEAKPYLCCFAAFFFGPLLLALFGLSPCGPFFIRAAAVLCGALGAGIGILAVEAGRARWPLLFLLPYSVCAVSAAAETIRIQAALRACLRTGGLFRPDMSGGKARILVSMITLVLCAAALAAVLGR